MIDRMPANTAGILAALATNPHEQCGFITEDWGIVTITNVAEQPWRNFFFDPIEKRAAIQEHGAGIIGVFHTHPGGSLELSEGDRAGFPPKGLRYWIVAGTRITEYTRRDDGTIITAGRPVIAKQQGELAR